MLILSLHLAVEVLDSSEARTTYIYKNTQQKLIIFFYFVVVVADNELYSGTVADFSGSDPIIYREPLQTEQYDSLSLNGK